MSFLKYLNTPSGVVQTTSPLDEAKTFTRKALKMGSRIPATSNEYVLFSVHRTGAIHCWPYDKFRALLKKAPIGEIQLLPTEKIDLVAGDISEYANKTVEIPSSAADRFINGVTSLMTNSALAFAAAADEERKRRAVSAKKTKKIKSAHSSSSRDKPKKAAKKPAKKASDKAVGKSKKAAKKTEKPAKKSTKKTAEKPAKKIAKKSTKKTDKPAKKTKKAPSKVKK